MEALLPKSMEGGLRVALAEHPAISAALHGVDTAQLQVKVVVDTGAVDAIEQAVRDSGTSPSSRPV